MRTRVRHREYGWVGDLAEIRAGKWYVCRWDSGESSTEHEDDVEVTSIPENVSR